MDAQNDQNFASDQAAKTVQLAHLGYLKISTYCAGTVHAEKLGIWRLVGITHGTSVKRAAYRLDRYRETRLCKLKKNLYIKKNQSGQKVSLRRPIYSLCTVGLPLKAGKFTEPKKKCDVYGSCINGGFES